MSPRTHSSAAIAIQTHSSPQPSLLPSNQEPAAATTHWKVIPTVVGVRTSPTRNQAFGHNNVDRTPDLQHNLNHQNPPSKRNDLRVVCENQENVFTSQAHQHRHPDTRRNRNLQCRIHSFLYIIQTARSDQVAQHNLGCPSRSPSHKHNQYWQKSYNIPWLQ